MKHRSLALPLVIQANMDPAHRDRIAFLRVCSEVVSNAV